MKNILIIGCKGFIGSNLFDHFKDKGFNVFAADVVIDYNTDQKYFLIDATNSNYDTIFRDFEIEVCINCSGAASVIDSFRNPQRDFHLNVSNLQNILNSIQKYRPSCKFLNLSSAAVYGSPDSLPIKENACLKPISPYGFHKMMSEQICYIYHKYFNLSTCSLRIFSAYGEGLKKQIFWDLHQKARANEVVELYGTGNESRDYIYIKDLVRAVEIVSCSDLFRSNVINVANGIEISIKDAVRTFYNIYDKNIQYRFIEKQRAGDPENWVADISLLKSLGYKQDFDLKLGLKNYITWLKAKN